MIVFSSGGVSFIHNGPLEPKRKAKMEDNGREINLSLRYTVSPCVLEVST